MICASLPLVPKASLLGQVQEETGNIFIWKAAIKTEVPVL